MSPSPVSHVFVSRIYPYLCSQTHRLLVLSVDVMDISGEVQRDITHNILKMRLNKDGSIVPNTYSAQLQNDLDKMNQVKQKGYCGSCYGGLAPEGGCCNSCEDVRMAYVNRGWSFSNPDAIEQVRHFFLSCLRLEYVIWHSVKTKGGQISFKNRLMRDVVSQVVFA